MDTPEVDLGPEAGDLEPSDGSTDPGSVGLLSRKVKVGKREIDLDDPGVEMLRSEIKKELLTLLNEVNALGICGFQVVGIIDKEETMEVYAVALLEDEWTENVSKFRTANSL